MPTEHHRAALRHVPGIQAQVKASGVGLVDHDFRVVGVRCNKFGVTLSESETSHYVFNEA